jgi:galactokinase/mevalonate kinase-like predicted kinase
MASSFEALEGGARPDCLAACDPPGSRLGSGGGCVHLLVEAWSRTGAGLTFLEWLRGGRALVIHGGGQSRRLPAYAACGKILAPMPVWRWATGQRLGQTLLDLQAGAYLRLLERAPEGTAAMIASGDVLIGFEEPPEIPSADVVGCGLWADAEQARSFGVFFMDRGPASGLDFFLQKPSAGEIRESSRDHLYLVDSGMWLLSEKALAVLFERCGMDIAAPEGIPSRYDFYGDFAPTLGRRSSRAGEGPDLSSAVMPLPDGRFQHFGSSRELIESSLALQNRVIDQRKLTASLPKPHPSIFIQNAVVEAALSASNESLWIENAHVGRGWRLSRRHVVTGVPRNDWEVDLDEGTCLDIEPVGVDRLCVRAYGFDDPFRGPLSSADWLGAPAALWFERRGIDPVACGLDPSEDIQASALFPVVDHGELDGTVLRWLTASEPEPSARLAQWWAASERLSADELGLRANLGRLYAQRRAFRLANLPTIERNAGRSVFYSLDLSDTARDWAATDHPEPAEPPRGSDPIREIRQWMFRSELKRLRGAAGWESDSREAFATLRRAVVSSLPALRPGRGILADQIIWARAPVRVDLAGGWTDTPPYCFMYGGRVVNAAIELNGQAPIQCYIRACEEPRIAIRSIDLGIEEIVEDYEGLARYAGIGSGFSIAKAALCQCGFHPEFGASRPTLREELEDFGGGFDVSLLSAVPKGSGLGTSSVLAGVVLGALGELCGFAWDREEIVRRALALEQMLGTGGGWQDQAGGVYGGLKLIESRPGFDQRLTVRWLPDDCLSDERCESHILLYYTGITRVANDILREIVRGMFLNSTRHLDLLRSTGENALSLFDAAQRECWPLFAAGVARTWELKRALDPGTDPAPIAAIIGRTRDWLDAWKLPGAGGGGFLLMLAKDPEAAARVRVELESRPPNARARFVRMSLSRQGLQITKS